MSQSKRKHNQIENAKSNERGDCMKKRVKMGFISVLLGTCLTLTGCKVAYKDIVKALDEGDMKTVMAASDDGYAYV